MAFARFAIVFSSPISPPNRHRWRLDCINTNPNHVEAWGSAGYLAGMATVESPKMPVPAGAHFWPVSVKAYHALGEMGLIPKKTELLYGQIFHKVSKSPIHSLRFLRLLGLLQAAVPRGLHVRPEQPIVCGDSEPEPDISVLRGSIDDYSAEHPATAELVIEVCVSSHEYDRSKLGAYAGALVKEVWLVLAPEKQVEIYREPAGREFAEHILFGPGGRIASTAVPEFSIDLDDLFAE